MDYILFELEGKWDIVKYSRFVTVHSFTYPFILEIITECVFCAKVPGFVDSATTPAPWTLHSNADISLLVHESPTEPLERILESIFSKSSPEDLITTNWPLQNSGHSWTRKLGWRGKGNFY